MGTGLPRVEHRADVRHLLVTGQLYAAGDVPAWQVVVSAVLCAVGTVWMARLAAKIYANSILRTGPRISFRQAIRQSRQA